MTQLLASHLSTILGFAMATLLTAAIVAQRRAPGTTFAWLLAIVLIPYVGVPLYLVFGGRKLKRRGGKAALYAKGAEAPAGPHDTIASMLCASGAPPPRAGNTFELLPTGETAFAEIVATLETATRSIYVSTLILGADEVGDAILGVLERKAKAGVEVHVLLDALFKRRAGRKRLVALQTAGGHVAWFMPVIHVPFLSRLRANLRLHRKIIVVDGQVAIVGGMNLAHEYMGPTPAPERWRDLSARVRGPAVDDLAAVFRADWAFAAGQELAAPPASPATGDTALQVVGSGPDVADDLIYDAFLSAVFAARRRLWIATPYFVPDEGLLRALVLAVRRGVDVRVVVPARSNHRTADYAGASYLRAVAAAGGSIACYEPSMMHGKAVLVDDTLAAIGSANVDMRSLFLNYEIAVFCTTPAPVGEVAAWFESRLFPQCGALAPAGRGKALVEAVARLIGPLE
ncbi:MAG TPA: phospholipase D-like domain-containing protein [Kofleriaceae bacterium]|nr:phospholipase D-like domain-containing protein [Kofleriaceae bacterium]